MSKHVRYAYGLLLAVMLVALSVMGIGPAFAQQQGTQTPGAGLTVQSGDTLGDILGRFTMTELQVQQFLIANAGLEVDAGQTVTFPAGVPVTGAEGGQVGTSTAQPTIVGTGTPTGGTVGALPTGTAGAQGTAVPATGGQVTGTPRVGATQSTAQGTGVPATGGQLTGTPGATQVGPAGFQCDAGNANPGQTYITQAGDTLGTLLTAMGLEVPLQGTAVPATGGQVTGTPVGRGTAVPATGGQVTGTPGAGGVQATAQGTGVPATGAQVTSTAQGTTVPRTGGQPAGQVTTDQVLEFVYLNCDLRFDAATAQTLVVPAGIPQTGGQPAQATQVTGTPRVGATQATAQGTGVPGTGGQVTGTPGATQVGVATATQGAQPGGQVTATRVVQQGTSIPQTGQQAISPLCHPYADPENLRHLAIYVARGGDSITGIAQRFGTTVDEILRLNPQITDPNLIYNQQWILLNPGERVVVNPPGWEQTCDINR